MPLTYPFDVDAASALPRLITITKGEVIHRFTTWDQPITISGVTWIPQEAASVKTLVFRINGDAALASVSLAASPDNLIPQTDAVAGKYRGGSCLIEVCDPDDLASGKTVWLAGVIGPIEEERKGEQTLLNISVRGANSLLRGVAGLKYGATCPLDLGDDQCRVPILPADQTRGKVYVTKANASTVDGDGTGFATRVRTGSFGGLPTEYENVYYECTTAGTTHASVQPTYDPTPGNTTTDGSATFTCRDAWTRAFEVASLDPNGFDVTLTALPDLRAVDGWYTEGYAIIRAGLTPGLLIPIANWINATNTLVSWDLLTLAVAAGDVGEIIVGCDHRRTTCFGRFDNILNFHGYGTFAPGRSIADATT